MVYILVSILLFIGIMLTKQINNKFNLILELSLFGMSLILISIIFYISSSSNYEQIASPIFAGDYRLYLWMSKHIHMSLSNLLWLKNIGVVLYLTSLYLMSKKFVIYQSSTLKNNLIRLSFGIYSILYLIFYNPNMANRVYIQYHTADDIHKILIKIVFSSFHIGLNALLFVGICYPFYNLLIYLKSSKTQAIKKQISYISITLLLLTICFYYMNSIIPIGPDLNAALDTGFWYSLYKSEFISSTSYLTLFVIIIILMLLFFIFVSKYARTDYFEKFRNKKIEFKMRSINNTVRDVLHSQKNTIFAMKMYTQNALNAKTLEEKNILLEQLLTLQNSTLNITGNALDNIKNVKKVKCSSDVCYCIKESIKQINIPNKIKVGIAYKTDDFICNVDSYNLIKVFTNILNNAIESIIYSGKETGEIMILVDNEYEYLYIQFKDNGQGIDTKNLKRIFRPYFTTKLKQKNWGVGLAYVYNVITTHYGYVWAESKKTSYTSINILLNRR